MSKIEQDEVLRMAQEAGAEATHYETWGDVYEFDVELLERFAAPLAQQDTHATHVVRTKDPCHPWQDLTDDEILRAIGITDPQGCIKHSEFIGDARAVIAADREKNRE